MKIIGQLSWQYAAVFVAFVLFNSATHAATDLDASYSITSQPLWVKSIAPTAKGSDDNAVKGERYMLLDQQHHYDGSVVSNYRHSLVKIVGQAGLSDNSKISISYDPGYQRLELHSATVLRNGNKSDRLNRARIDIARTEDRSEQDLLSGEVTALIVLPDIAVGDIVETAYTIVGRNPVFGSRHHSSWRVRWGVPVENSVIRVTVPAGMTLSHTARPEARLSEETGGRLQTLQWVWEDIESTDAERDTTRWYPHPDRLDVTAYKNWQEVAEWGAALFANHSKAGDKYRRLTQSIGDVADSKGLEPAIAMAIDHVQKRIRYYGLELGENSHRPHAPDEVLRNGYGDCKDKALLLVSLLDDLDVKAWPILVSSRNRRGITDRLPSPGVFDHVVVLIQHKGKEYWVDATDNRQSGYLGFRGQPEYGAGVVLGRAGDPMVIRVAPVPTQPELSTHDKFYLSALGGPVEFVSTTTYRGKEANRFRRRLDEYGNRQLQKNHQKYYQRLYGKLKPQGEFAIARNRQRNTITIEERYRLNKFWSVDRRSYKAEFDTFATTVRSVLTEPPEVEDYRKAPIPITGPTWVQHTIQYFPNVASKERALEDTRFELEGFEYRDSEYVLGDSLVFESELKVSVDELEAKELGAYKKFYNRAMRNARSGRYYQTVKESEIKLGEDTTTLLNELGGIFQ